MNYRNMGIVLLLILFFIFPVADTKAQDTKAPVITVLGSNPVNVYVGSGYTDAGATASDNVDGNITASIVTVNPVVTSTIGTYSVTYDVSDAAGNHAKQKTRTVNVVAIADTTAPVITVLGSDPVNVYVGSGYTDAGATASDDVDGNITASIVTVNPVVTSTIGTYTVTYDVSDVAGNHATQKTRTVNVVAIADTTAPVITVLGSDPVNVYVGSGYTDAGATASDDVDGNITASIVTVNPVVTSTIGTYTVTYDVSDAAGNHAIQKTRTVKVQADPTYSVSGYVFDNNNAGLEGVNIQNGTNQNTSKAAGHYLIRGLLNGSYNFSYSKSGFETNYSIITISGSDATIANMTLVGIPATVASHPPSSGGGSSSGGGGSGGGTSGENFTNIIMKEKYDLYIYKDIVTSYKFANINNPILSINIVGNVNAGEIGTAVEVLRNTSSLVMSPAPGDVYKNVNMWVGTSGFGTSKNIKQAVITFRIENSWIGSNNMKSSSIKMVRWDGSKWDQLETSEKSKNSTYIYFEAKTDLFSSFAITGIEKKEYITENAIITEPTKPTAAIQTEEKKSDFLTKWFIIIGVFFAIGLIIDMYLRMKKK
jgi:PGF-pre-PGF domain-containing protein